jgi:hypothetical protein
MTETERQRVELIGEITTTEEEVYNTSDHHVAFLLSLVDQQSSTISAQEKELAEFHRDGLAVYGGKIKLLNDTISALEGEISRLHEKYDLQLLVKRDKELTAELSRLKAGIERIVEVSTHPVNWMDMGKIARELLAGGGE